MDIHLINEYTSDNLGDAVIYESIVKLAQVHKVRSHMPARQRARVLGLQGQRQARADDVFISAGGDIFNNARPGFVTRNFLGNLRELAQCPPDRTFLFGQSIPHSCRGLSFKMLCAALRRLSSVTVRDEESHQRLRQAGIDARLSYDSAFAYEIGPQAIKAGQVLFDAHGILSCNTVLMSVRGFDAMYPHDNQVFVGKMAALCQQMLRRGHVPVVLLQADAEGADSDRSVIHELRRRVPGVQMMSPFELGDGHRPVDAFVGAVALANAVVAVRYHTTVIRLLAGRQAFNLPYSLKGRDLMKRLALPGSSLEDFTPETALSQIENSAGKHFNAVEQKDSVNVAFRESLEKASRA